MFTGAASPNPTSLDVNPAALGLGVKRELYLAALGVLDQYSVELDSASGSVDQTTMSPGGAFAFIWHSGENGRVTLGVGIRSAPAERFLEDDALRYHVNGGYHRTVSPLALGASVRLSRRLYVGASIAAQSTFLKLRYARDTALEAGRDPDAGVDSDCDGAPCGIGNPLASEDYEVDVDSGLFSTEILVANVGAVVMLAQDVWLGVGYHSPPGFAIENDLSGTVDVGLSPREGGGAIRGASTVFISQPASVDVALRARIRETLDLHVGGRWEHLSRFSAYDVRGYGSTFRAADIPEWQRRPRGFDSTVAVWAGVEQVERAMPVIVGGRIGFETSALEDEKTSPLTIAPASITLDGGVQYRVGESLILQASYGLQYFPTVDVTRSTYDAEDRLACIDSGFDYTAPACATVRAGYALPSAAGSYSRIQHAMRLAVRIELD